MHLGDRSATDVVHEPAVIGWGRARAQRCKGGGTLGAIIGVGHVLAHKQDVIAGLHGATRKLNVVVRVVPREHLGVGRAVNVE